MATTLHPNRPPDIASLVQLLEAHKIQYVVVGSVAAMLYGVDVRPGDFDITPLPERANLMRLSALLREIKARLSDEAAGHWEPQPDGERKWVAEEMTAAMRAERMAWSRDIDDISSFDHLFLTRYGNFDVVADLSGGYEDLMSRAERLQAHGRTLWVAHVDDLLAALTVPRRKKDVPRVRELRQIQHELSVRENARHK